MALTVQSNVPIPDPSTVTTERIEKLRGEMDREIQRSILALRELFSTRLEGMDRAIELLAIGAAKVPIDAQTSIDHLRDILAERFQSFDHQLMGQKGGIALQFDERDVRTEQSAIATKTAVDAALQAQKEAANNQNVSNAAAIAKSEVATTKQIDALMALRQSDVKASDEKIADLKGRLDRGEGMNTGKDHTQGTILAVVAIGISLLVGGVSIVTNLRSPPERVLTAPAVVPVH